MSTLNAQTNDSPAELARRDRPRIPVKPKPVETPALVRPPTAKPIRTAAAKSEAEQPAEEKAMTTAKASAAAVFRLNPSWLLSAIVHMILLLCFALITLTMAEKEPEIEILASVDTTDELPEQLEELPITIEEPTVAENLHESQEFDISESVDVLADLQLSMADLAATDLADVGLSANSLPEGAMLGREIGGLSGQGPPGELFGSKVQGNVAVVFDATASMYVSIQRVLREIESNFDRAQVVVVHGATFKPYGSGQLIPYARNLGVQQYMHKNTSRRPQQLPLLKQVHEQLVSLYWCDSLAPEGFLQSLGAAVEALLRQRDGRPGTIFVFSDFQDGADPSYMQAVAGLAKELKVKVVFYHPQKFTKDRTAYAAFVAASGGELRENLPE